MNFGIEKKFKIVILISCLFIPSVRNEVSPKFQSCRQKFFLNGRIPEGFPEDGNNDIMTICQRYKGTYRFATLYSVRHRIPIYSAYVLESSPAGKRPMPKVWFIEPQVSNKKNTKEKDMKKEGTKKDYSKAQTVNSDMKVVNGIHVYDRGHLSPSSYHSSDDGKLATFTLTNMVPQFHDFNCQPWNKAEQNTLDITKDHCILSHGISYFITGAIPSEYNLLNGRVNIPTEMWTAVCCEGNDENQTYTYGFYRSNENSTEKVILTDLSSLQNRLKRLYAYNRGSITLFDGKCNKKTQEVPDFVKTTFQSDVTPYVCQIGWWEYCCDWYWWAYNKCARLIG